MASEGPPKPVISRREWGIIVLLASVYFTHILDFMIVMPLGPQMMEAMQITPTQFGNIVSVYGFAAFAGSLLSAMILDRWDRKKALLLMYFGFTISTLACGFASTFETMIAARAAAGVFGGVVSVTIMTIIGDLFADYRRGTATGAVLSAFAVASIIGVPIGLESAEAFGPAAPFELLAGLSAIVWVSALRFLPKVHGHLEHRQPSHRGRMMLQVMAEPNHQRAYLFSFALVLGSFTVVPYIATYMVKNGGVQTKDVSYIYLCGGICTLIAMNMVGRWSDRYGKLLLFRIMALSTIVMVAILTNLPEVSLFMGVMVCTLFMVFTAARIVPAQAMITASSDPKIRGVFLGVNASLQHLATGIASSLAGYFLEEVDGKLTGYPIAGLFAITSGLLAIYLAGRLRATELKIVA